MSRMGCYAKLREAARKRIWLILDGELDADAVAACCRLEGEAVAKRRITYALSPTGEQWAATESVNASA